MALSGKESTSARTDVAQSGMDWTAQLQAYIAWVNSQLKKKLGTRPIEDLRIDMRDGTALADLIEIVAGEKLAGVHDAPSNMLEMQQNIEKVLQFMMVRRIRMHHTTAKDIVEGNLKSIMRLILALAAHFKPSSVKQSAQGYRASPRSSPSVTGIAQGAVAALADARRDAASVSQRPRRPKQLRDEARFYNSGSDSDQSYGDRVRMLRNRDLDGASSGSSPTASARESPRSSMAGSPHTSRKLDFSMQMTKSRSQDFEPGHVPPSLNESTASSCFAGSITTVQFDETSYQELLDEHVVLSEEMQNTKRTLLKLQELLLSGQPPDGQETTMAAVDDQTLLSLTVDGVPSEEQVVILKSKLQQSEELCKELREELSRARNDVMQLQGTKSGLQKRLAELEESYLKMKAELLRVGFAQQSWETEKADLQRQLSEKEAINTDLRRELTHRDRQIEDLVRDLQLQLQEKDSMTRSMRTQIQSLHDRLQRVGETEASLSAKVASQDRKMARLEGKILQTPYDSGPSRPSSARSGHSGGSDDLQLVRESLRSLRTSFPGNDPKHHTVDQLETSIASLMDRLQLSESENQSRRESIDRGARVNYDSTGDVRRSPITAIQGFPVQRLDGPVNGHSSTKVLYFTDRTVTPFMCTIPKRLGEICLRDFKNMFDRQGNYRFHFKALDPEFGTVKEEITHDDDIVPGWEGKIVAWIEEDHG